MPRRPNALLGFLLFAGLLAATPPAQAAPHPPRACCTGVYLYRLAANGSSETRRMVVVK